MDKSRTTTRIQELLAQADWARRLALTLGHDDADADDLVQDACVVALQRPPETLARPQAWFAGVVRNLSRMRWRTEARRDRREQVAADAKGEPPDDPSAIVQRMELQRLLADALLSLDEPYRSTLVLRYLDGLSGAEIARRIHVNAATVRGRIRDGLARLREELDRRHQGRRDLWLAALAPLLALPAAGAAAAGVAGATGTASASTVPVGTIVVGCIVAVGLVAGIAALVPSGGEGQESTPAVEAPPIEPESESEADAVLPEPEAGVSEPPAPEPPAPVPPEPTPEGGPEPTEEPAHVAMPPATPPSAEPEAPAVPTPVEVPEAPSVPRPRTPEAHPTSRPPVSVAISIPAGMVRVPAGTARIGTPWERIDDVLAGRPASIRRLFAFESPQRAVPMAEYCIDLYEVSNAQYLRFLEDTAETSYDTDSATLANLEEVAGFLIGLPQDRWPHDNVAWRQLYRTHRDLLHERMPDRVVHGAAGDLDEVKTESSFRHAPLPRGLELVFWNRKPPETWLGARPAEAMLDLPVLSVSYDDAEAFAEWAGKHVPTEEEWEYAARGPDGLTFPWGTDADKDGSRANWGGKHKGADLEPVPLPVDSLPEGRSWCGVHHLLGNAAEWTSSWFAPYPGNERDHPYIGEYVKVIRGATYMDESPLVLRLAARNFVGPGVYAPPRPGNRFAYVGFRCAWYREPGRDRLGPIVERIQRGRRVLARDLALDRWAGTATTHYAEPGVAVPHHIYVTDAARAIVVVPLAQLFERGSDAERVRARKGLIEASEESVDPLPLAVLHTDVGLENVFVRAPEGESPGGRRRRRPGGPPPTRSGTVPPGTYLLCLWHGRPALAYPTLEFVGFLTKAPARRGEVDLQRLLPEEHPDTLVEVHASADLVFVGLCVPVGGRNDPRDAVVLKTIDLHPIAGTLEAAGDWR